MIKKLTRTLSGVAPIAVVIKPEGSCKHNCIYCPKAKDVPKSYTPKSPAIMRARKLGYDPYKQVKARIKAFKAMNHETDKIELIILGGTFLEMPLSYQEEFVKRCFDALNDIEARNLEEAKKINDLEAVKHKCVALTIETRPDVAGKEEIKRMLYYGVTRAELGVQSLYNSILKKVRRGHYVEDTIKATRLLKDSGFKVGYHIMPGLPGSNPEKDLRMYKKLFSCSDFRPDQIKIYPTMPIEGSELVKLVKEGKFKPYNDETLINLISEMKKITPRYCRIIRIMRDIPKEFIIEGTHHIHLREEIKKYMKERNERCYCIRCREVGFYEREYGKTTRNIFIKVTRYKASKGKEIFIEFVNDKDVLFALLRLRIPYKPFLKEITKKTLIVRELHVFGKAAKLNDIGDIQHRGLGKALMKEAENIARKEGMEKIAIISGIGVREYYRKLGYSLEGPYMCKWL